MEKTLVKKGVEYTIIVDPDPYVCPHEQEYNVQAINQTRRTELENCGADGSLTCGAVSPQMDRAAALIVYDKLNLVSNPVEYILNIKDR